MSKADEMFEELGYKKEDLKDKFGRVWGVSYKNKEYWVEIEIDYMGAEVCAGTIDIADRDSEPVYIGMQELEAINEKCREIGWL